MGGGVGLVVGVIIGAVIVTSFGYYESGGVQIPFNFEHNALAGKVRVTVNGRNTELKHLLSTLAPFYPQTLLESPGSQSGSMDMRDIAKFAQSTGNLPMSIWAFVQSGNVQVTMSVMGPPTSNDSIYIVEFGRLTFEGVHITGLGYTVDWSQGSQDGYAMETVSYP